MAPQERMGLMDIICITGTAPGPVSVTVSHAGDVRQLPMVIERHASGGWQARGASGTWGPRCHSVRTAALLEAAEVMSQLTTAEAMAAE
jgi:hypothetical protein